MIASKGLKRLAAWVLGIVIALSLIALLDMVLTRLAQASSAPLLGQGCNCHNFSWPEYRLDRIGARSLINGSGVLFCPNQPKSLEKAMDCYPSRVTVIVARTAMMVACHRRKGACRMQGEVRTV